MGVLAETEKNDESVQKDNDESVQKDKLSPPELLMEKLDRTPIRRNGTPNQHNGTVVAFASSNDKNKLLHGTLKQVEEDLVKHSDKKDDEDDDPAKKDDDDATVTDDELYGIPSPPLVKRSARLRENKNLIKVEFDGKVKCFQFEDVPPDGHCMFHALSRAANLKMMLLHWILFLPRHGM